MVVGECRQKAVGRQKCTLEIVQPRSSFLVDIFLLLIFALSSSGYPIPTNAGFIFSPFGLFFLLFFITIVSNLGTPAETAARHSGNQRHCWGLGQIRLTKKKICDTRREGVDAKVVSWRFIFLGILGFFVVTEKAKKQCRDNFKINVWGIAESIDLKSLARSLTRRPCTHVSQDTFFN